MRFNRFSLPRVACFVSLLLLLAARPSAAADDAAVTRDLAERGNASAQLLLGLAYLRGDWGLARDPHLGAQWLEKAALAGNAYAQDRLADLYETGLGVARSPALAKDWREKAAHRGNVHAQLTLGKAYLAAPEDPHNAGLAREWLQRADSQGSTEAATLLAQLEPSDERRGPNGAFLDLARHAYPEMQWLIDHVKALNYTLDELLHEHPVQLAGLANDGDVEAQYELGRQFESGHGVAADLQMAVRWYERAAKRDHHAAIGRLAALYASGSGGMAADPAQARYWQTRLAALDSVAAEQARSAPESARGGVDLEAAADLIAFLLSAAMVAAYYYYLSRKVAADPTFTIHGVNQLARKLWVLNVMRNPSKDVMAVQTLRNFIMGASLMASTATLLIIGTLTLSGQADSISRSWQVLNMHGSHAAEIWVVKVLLLLITFIVAFFAFAMCVRLTNHVLFMMNVSEQDAHDELSPEKVANRLNRAGSLFALGMRAFFVAIPLAFWLFGPIFLVLASIGLVISLYRLDRSRVGSKRQRMTVPAE